MDPSKSPAPTTTTMPTTTTLQRKKKNGNLERLLPVPFPLPVINRQDKSNIIVLGPTHYFHNLEQALHSVTIDPIPIRGYDWTELIQRGRSLRNNLLQSLTGTKFLLWKVTQQSVTTTSKLRVSVPKVPERMTSNQVDQLHAKLIRLDTTLERRPALETRLLITR